MQTTLKRNEKQNNQNNQIAPAFLILQAHLQDVDDHKPFNPKIRRLDTSIAQALKLL
jgi:hypothetical protein